MKKYEKYKDSGIEWLGEIPEHWGTCKIKHIVNLKSGDFISAEEISSEGEFPVLGGNGLRGFTKKFNNDGEHILIGRQGALCGNINYGSNKFWATEHAIVAYPLKKINTFFIGELFRHMNLNQYSESAAQPGISVGKISNLQIPLVPLPEQTAIASFLEHKTAQIDALIEKKEQLIEKLKLKRQAIINEAVTKGLNPDVPMKDSGIEWLGEIPEHWKLVRLKHLIKELESGVSVNSTDIPVSDNHTFGILKTSCVYDFTFSEIENKQVVAEEYNRVKCPVKKDSIIISRMNTPELVGASGYVPRDCPNLFLPDRLWQTVMFDDAPVDVKFISLILISDSYRKLISSKASGTSPSMKNITKDDLLNTEIGLPTMKEQISIVSFLNNKTETIKAILDKTSTSIEKLKLYRQSIISEAVTGKIDVRDWEKNN